MIFATVGGSIMYFIQPSLPDYDITMREGERLPGKVTAVEPKQNIRIQDKNPNEVFFTYGIHTQESGQMIMALDQKPTPGQDITVRVRQGQAYPEGIAPFRFPNWLWAIPIGIAALGLVSLLIGIIKVFFKLVTALQKRG